MAKAFLTIRTFCALCLLIVRGVLPRSFPGVLNISVTLLCLVNAVIIRVQDGDIHSIIAKYLCHVLIKPVDFIAGSECKILSFLIDELRNLISLVSYPLRGADCRIARRPDGSHLGDCELVYR